jgi:hypothetical protein
MFLSGKQDGFWRRDTTGENFLVVSFSLSEIVMICSGSDEMGY